jgi:hypothetical protein
MPKSIDLTGYKFGRLLVIKNNILKIKRMYKCLCLCDCGKKVIVYKCVLRDGRANSCGCLNKELSSIRLKTHGLSKQPFHIVWVNMIQRCTNENNEQYHNYGGRGITVCEKWLGFSGFYADMYHNFDENLELDRIDNNKGYYKENCRWATIKVNSRNKRTTKLNDLIVAEIREADIKPSALAKKYKVHTNTIYKVLNNKTWA